MGSMTSAIIQAGLLLTLIAAPDDAPAETCEAPLALRGETAAAGFAQEPRVENTAQGVGISFAVEARTDVEVTVLDGKGRVVRHLGAGLLGRHSPPPFQKDSLRQELTWDGKDDDGRIVELKGCRVRVRLGLGAKLDRMIPGPVGQLAPPTALGVGPGGEVYALSNRDKAGGVSIYVLSRQGKYLRTILPPPANLTGSQL